MDYLRYEGSSGLHCSGHLILYALIWFAAVKYVLDLFSDNQNIFFIERIMNRVKWYGVVLDSWYMQAGDIFHKSLQNKVEKHNYGSQPSSLIKITHADGISMINIFHDCWSNLFVVNQWGCYGIKWSRGGNRELVVIIALRICQRSFKGQLRWFLEQRRSSWTGTP